LTFTCTPFMAASEENRKKEGKREPPLLKKREEKQKWGREALRQRAIVDLPIILFLLNIEVN